MDEAGEKIGNRSAAERPLIEAAWAQFESLAASHPPRSAGARPTFAIPGYRVLREIHRGGQGVVYQAMHESTQRKVAIKFLKEGPLADPTELARFDREVDVLSRLSHPHIVSIHDRGSTDGHAYYVMDYISGRSLDAYVASTGLSTREILGLCHKVCEAVNVAHLRGVIHRDLKPSNIRIDEDGRPHILDFGLAKLARDSGSSAETMTMTGQFVGSLPWSSPEQAEGRSELLDIRTDVYSLGVILYQLLTRSFPYPVSGRMDDVVRNIIHTSPARPSTLSRDIERDVEVILFKCLAKDPERRYQSAGELARDIQRYLNGEPIEARPSTSLYQFRQFARRNKALVTSVMAIIIVLAAATTVSVAFALREAAARDRERLALVREVDHRERAEQQRRRAEAINQFVTKALQASDPHEGGKQAMLVSDAMLRAVEEIESGAFQDDPETEAELLRTISGVLNRNARPAEALALSERALTHLRRIFPGDHSEVSKGLIHHASILRTLARNAEAEPMIRESLAMERRMHDGDHADVARSMMDLATTLRHLGRAAESLRYSRDALAMRRRMFNGDHEDIAASLNNLYLALHALGRNNEAEPLAREALEMRQRLFPGDHPDVSQSLNNLGYMLHVLDRTAEAESLYREALAMRRRLFIGDHPDVARTLNNLGTLLHPLGKYQEAEEVHREALEMRKRLFEGDHPDIAQSMSNLAFPLQSLGRHAEAEPLLREALEMKQRWFEGDHPDTAISLENLASVLDKMGRSVEAETLARDALEMSRRLTPGDHPDVASRLDSLAQILVTLERFEEAETLARQRLEMTKRVFHGDHTQIAKSLHLVGAVLQYRDKLTGAEPFHRDAVAMYRRLHPADYPNKANAIADLGDCLAKLKRYDEAESLYREALEIYRRLVGDEHADTLGEFDNLGACLLAQGRSTEAIDLMAPAEPAARRALTGGNAPRLARFLTALGRARVSARDFDAAEANLNEAQAIFTEAKGATQRDREDLSMGLVELYDARHAAAPDKGYDEMAAEWRARLPEPTVGP